MPFGTVREAKRLKNTPDGTYHVDRRRIGGLNSRSSWPQAGHKALG